MRAALLPPLLRVTCVEPAAEALRNPASVAEHYVLTASAEVLGSVERLSSSSIKSKFFMMSDLSPLLWSQLLRFFQHYSTTDRAYTFSSPGFSFTQETNDVGESKSVPARRLNGVCFHLVARRPNDFLPNNMLYHILQQPEYSPVCGDGREATGFATFLRRVQEGVEGIGLEDIPSPLPSPGFSDTLLDDPEAPSCSAHNKSASEGKGDKFFFFPHSISVRNSIPFFSSHFAVLVNLKPIVPYHLLVVPHRCVGALKALNAEESADFGFVMHLCLRVLDRVRQEEGQGASAGNYSVAVQQGMIAGQTVPHLHVHVIPFDPCGSLASTPEADEEEQRRRPPRTPEAMREETQRLHLLFVEVLKEFQ